MASKFIRRFCTKIKDQAIKDLKGCPPDKCAKEPKTEIIIDEPRQSPHRVNVSLQGANCRAGLTAALLLKQHPLIKKIYMHDMKLNSGIAKDLNCIDSSAKVEVFCGDKISYSLRAADIVVLIDTDRKEVSPLKKFEYSYYRVKTLAEICSLHCPKAIIINCVEPLTPMVYLIQSVLEETPLYHPSRLLGNVTYLQSQINCIVGNYFNIDPTIVHIPILGGADGRTAIPLISLMTPDLYLSPRDQTIIYDKLKKEMNKPTNKILSRKSTISEGYAIAKMVITVAKGLDGQEDALACGLARTSQMYPLKYLVTTLKFGLSGIYHNYGIPKITAFELEQFEQTLLLLGSQEKKMNELFERQMKLLKSECECNA